MGSSEVPPTSQGEVEIHARARAPAPGSDLERLREDAFQVFVDAGLPVNEIDTRTGIENAMGRYPDRDVVLAAGEIVAWWLGKDPAERGRLNLHSALMTAMRDQQKPQPAGGGGDQPEIPERFKRFREATRDA